MAEHILTDAQLESLGSRRKRFTDEDIEVALKYMIDHPTCTMEDAAAKHGMTAQTLGTRRKLLIEKRKAVAVGQPAPAKKTTKGAVKK